MKTVHLGDCQSGCDTCTEYYHEAFEGFECDTCGLEIVKEGN